MPRRKRKGGVFGIFFRGRRTRKTTARSRRNFNLGAFGIKIGGKHYHYDSSSPTKAGALSMARELRGSGAKTKVQGKRGDWNVFYR